MEFAVEASDVNKHFGGTRALAGVNLQVAPGSVHGLVGRNGAGKSTLVSILTGLLVPDSGEIRFDGAPAPSRADREAWLRKAACVYQHSRIVPHVSVAENIFLNRQPETRSGRIDWRHLRREARAMLQEWNLSLDVDAPGSTLSVEERQLVEIVRALSFGTRFVILDEPTARLEARAIERLFARIRALNAAGVTMLFISHHLQEIYDLCDAVTVLRDGRSVRTSSVASLTQLQLIEAMTGEAPRGSKVAAAAPEPRHSGYALEVTKLSGVGFDGVSATIAPGEIVGIAGIAGSGKASLAQTLAGLQRARAGSARVGGRQLSFGVRNARDAGIGFVPRDRHREGLVADLSVEENATLAVDDRLGPFGFIDPRKRRQAGLRAIKELEIVAAGPWQPVDELSGGNQQKVVFARALARDPKVLIAIDPTAGVDVKSKEALTDAIRRLRDGGTAILVVSDDLDDLRICDRVLVMFAGRVTAEFSAGWNDNELIARMEGLEVA
jgi:simple sugar transport system ATP-binding protein